MVVYIGIVMLVIVMTWSFGGCRRNNFCGAVVNVIAG